MKYCFRCGKELVDEAIICTGCGCSVQYDNRLVKKIEKPNVTDKENNMKIVHIFTFVSNIFFALTLSMILNALGSFNVRLFTNAYGDYVSVYVDEAYLYCSLISSFIYVGLSVVALILYTTRAKEKTLNKVFKHISRLIVAALLLSTTGILFGYFI